MGGSLAATSYGTVNSEIFTRVLFSRNFAVAEFREKKHSRKGENSLSFTDVGKPCQSREFFLGKYEF